MKLSKVNQHLTIQLLVCMLTLTSIVAAFQEKEESSTTVASFSSSSEEFHSSSESFSSEEISNSTTKAPRKPRRRTRNRKSNTGGGGETSASHESASTSSESFASTELVTVTAGPLRNDSLASSAASTVRPSAPLKQLTECEVKNLKSDKCLRDALFVGQESAVIPKTEDEMESYCVVKRQDFNCIREFGSKCLKNVPRQIYLTITKNVRKMFKEFCDSPAGKKTFLKHLECAKPEHLKILNEVLGRLTLSLEFVASNVTRDEMIFHACCTLQDTYEKIPSAMGSICAPAETPKETIVFFRSLVRRTVGDIVDIGCGKYSNLKFCESNLATGMASMRNYANDPNRALPANSFMTPLMNFAQKIDGSAQ